MGSYFNTLIQKQQQKDLHQAILALIGVIDIPEMPVPDFGFC